jgi:3-deoxy-manno-octulosonate cytidylyltransferase (CMP-KDO synthetase)
MQAIKAVGIIPARFASTRFPGKPLVDIAGQSMIQRVYKQAKKAACFKEVIVATDDARILDHVISFGGQAIMTSETHRSGTDRCAEVLSKLKDRPDVVVNIQGDEPFVDPSQLSVLVDAFEDQNTAIATLAKQLKDQNVLFNPNVPKVIFNEAMEAIYFSRSPIPYLRGEAESDWTSKHAYYKHIGIYAYRSDVLQKLAALPPSPLELAESLEQLRWLESGFRIRIRITLHESVSIDVPEDLQKITPKMLG